MSEVKNMKVGIMQPYFFPYIGYWQLINIVDKYVIFDDVNYIKRGWINRNRILYQGEAKYINVYLKGVSQNKLINEVEIGDKDSNYNNLNIIRAAYKNAPYFNQVYPVIECIITQSAKSIAQYNGFLLKKICEYLKIDTEFIYSSEIEKNNSLRGQDKIIEICRKLNASEYYNAIGGIDLYQRESFEKCALKLFFVQPNDICYKQFEDIFIPKLSIIDVMMFNSVDQIHEFISNYTLIE